MERILSQRKLQRITSPPDFVHDTATLSQSNQFRSFTGIWVYIWQEGLHWQLQNWVVLRENFFSKQPTKVTTTHTRRVIYIHTDDFLWRREVVPSGSQWYGIQMLLLCGSAVLSRLNHIIENWPWQLWTVLQYILGHDSFIWVLSRIKGSFCWELICKIHV